MHENLSLISRIYIKMPGIVVARERQVSGIHWTPSLSTLVNSRPMGLPVLKEVGGVPKDGHKVVLKPPHKCMYTLL